MRTWALKGCTPVVQFHFNWKHVSAIAGLTRSNFLFRLYDGAVKSAQIVEFLKALRAQLKRKLLIVWDGAAQHKSRIVREYLDSTKGAIQMALLDGQGQWRDNVFVERLWKSVKYEDVYLKAYETVSAARAGISAYIHFYNSRRPHRAHGGQTPDAVYFASLPATREAA